MPLKLLQLFKENDTGIRLTEQLFLQRFSFPLPTHWVIGMKHNRIEQGHNCKMGVLDILPVITGRDCKTLDFLKRGLGPLSECFPVRDVLPRGLQANDPRQQTLIQESQITRTRRTLVRVLRPVRAAFQFVRWTGHVEAVTLHRSDAVCKNESFKLWFPAIAFLLEVIIGYRWLLHCILLVAGRGGNQLDPQKAQARPAWPGFYLEG